MPRFCANISTMFTELPLPDRFQAAAGAGFEAVEIQLPYDFDCALLAERARQAAVEVVLINMPCGNPREGDRGIACLPSRVDEFRRGIGVAREYARALGCRMLNCLGGIAPAGEDEALLRRTFIENLRQATRELPESKVLIEPQNTRTFPNVFLRHTAQALSLIDEVQAPNLALQYDFFHMQVMEGDLAMTLERHLARIGHVQFADVPGRHEPGTGEINFAYLFDRIDRLGYRGWVGAEYTPAACTEEGLGWASAYLRRGRTP